MRYNCNYFINVEMKKLTLSICAVLALGLTSCGYVNKAKALIGLEDEKVESSYDENLESEEAEANVMEEAAEEAPAYGGYDFAKEAVEQVESYGEAAAEEFNDYYSDYDYNY